MVPVGCVRRNFLVPIPRAESFAASMNAFTSPAISAAWSGWTP